MKVFECQVCKNALHFENTVCIGCGHAVAYLPDRFEMSAITPCGDQREALSHPDQTYVVCANHDFGACNWLVPAADDAELCKACRHNRTIPDLSVGANLVLYQKLERAKHQLFYSLMRLKLPLQEVANGVPALAFDFLADTTAPDGRLQRATTGHESGLITINLDEANDPEREARRVAMNEPYRTLLGHFRHESGHYYWTALVRGDRELSQFRKRFGDESADYGAALAAYHANGPATGWQATHISAYATAHPWEDFAETWAHYLHIVDGVETAASFGVTVSPRIRAPAGLETEVNFDPYRVMDFDRLIEAWVPLTVALNSLNRSMGQPDLYPFVLSKPVMEKMRFIHGLMRAA